MITTTTEEVTLVLRIDNEEEMDTISTLLSVYVSHEVNENAAEYHSVEELEQLEAPKDAMVRSITLIDIPNLITDVNASVFAEIIEDGYGDDGDDYPDTIRIELVNAEHIPMTLIDEDFEDELPWYEEGEEYTLLIN